MVRYQHTYNCTCFTCSRRHIHICVYTIIHLCIYCQAWYVQTHTGRYISLHIRLYPPAYKCGSQHLNKQDYQVYYITCCYLCKFNWSYNIWSGLTLQVGWNINTFTCTFSPGYKSLSARWKWPRVIHESLINLTTEVVRVPHIHVYCL